MKYTQVYILASRMKYIECTYDTALTTLIIEWLVTAQPAPHAILNYSFMISELV